MAEELSAQAKAICAQHYNFKSRTTRKPAAECPCLRCKPLPQE